MTTILIAVGVATLILGVGISLAAALQLISQNGRLLLRVESLEHSLRALGLLLPGGPELDQDVPNVIGAFTSANPGLQFREQSNDLEILHEVVYQNCYRLPATFALHDVVIDIGTHVGIFALMALGRGCGEVYCFEPDPENAISARRNLQPYAGRAHLTEAAVWRSDRDQQTLRFQPSANPQNFGGGDVLQAHGREVAAQSFDDVLRVASNDGKRRVRFVKIDCEGSEYPILLTSKLLHLADEICGEYHTVPDELSAAWDLGRQFTVERLASHLSANGFRVEFRPYPESGSNAWGLFFARRVV